jgi:putative aldouronate transport system permease protein
MVDRSTGRKIFRIVNAAVFILYALLCLLPMIHVLSLSLSSSVAVTAGEVKIFPVEFTLKSYEFVLKKVEFWRAMSVSFERIILGVSLSTLMTILSAYPLSKSRREFRAQPVFIWIFVFTMLFSGGMIPSYMIVRYTGLIDKIWALIIPGAVQVFNVVLLMNYFRTIPKEIEESAFMDGASHWRILWKIYLPMSMPSLATIVVFAVVSNWNSWFDGLIYMNDARNYPLQTYLQSILISPNVKLITKEYADLMRMISDRTLKAAQVFIAAIPVLMIYPFLQGYFISGIMLGGVKE